MSLGMVASLALISSASALGADPSRGALLYENHCTACHASQAHIREARKVQSRAELRRWILRWQSELRLEWSSEEVDDVEAFLNETYYRLDSTP